MSFATEDSELNVHVGHGFENPRITEGLNFLLTLGLIHRIQIASVSGMATKFRTTGREGFEDTKQVFYTDTFWIGQPFVRLPIEVGAIPNLFAEATD